MGNVKKQSRRLSAALLVLAVSASLCRAQSTGAWEAGVSPPPGLGGRDLNTVYARYQDNLLPGTDKEMVWVGGDQGYFAYTSDGGRAWHVEDLKTRGPVYDIFFYGKDGYLVAGNTLYGNTGKDGKWVPAHTFHFKNGAVPTLYSVGFASHDRGCVVGVYSVKGKKGPVTTNGLIECTEDGESWHARDAPKRELLHVDFADERNGWVVGEGGVVLRTSDGGATWAQLHPAPQQKRQPGTPQPKRPQPAMPTLLYVKFINALRGWVVGDNASIFYTSDGGVNWQKVAAPLDVDKGTRLVSINFFDESRGWIVGRNGTILYTEDGGTTWKKKNSGTPQNLYALSAGEQDKKHAWIVGGSGTILKYKYP